ncbi:MAG: T9SS type A sorting domain-containing protein [Ignavibacteriales bacterium]|nr:T9SS type A sorting domain-containing protein [Ignavibacteriales bacterium]
MFGSDNYSLLKSSDKGVTWTQTSLNTSITDITVNSNLQLFAASNENGLYRSIDNGLNWERLSGGLTSGRYSSIIVHPNGYIFAGSLTLLEGVFRSTNNGNTWTQVSNGLPQDPLSYLYVTDITIASDSSIVLTTAFNGIFRSTDYGNNWINVLSGSFTSLSSNGNQIYASCYDDTNLRGWIYRSDDNGQSWVLTGWKFTRVKNILLRNGVVIASSDQGVGISTDNGSSWTFKNFGTDYQIVNSLEYDFYGKLFAVVNAGIYNPTDDGKNWYPFYPSTNNYYVKDFEKLRTGIMFMGTRTSSGGIIGAVFRSPNGQSWTKILDAEVWFLENENDSIIYIGTEMHQGLYRYHVKQNILQHLLGSVSVFSFTSKAGGILLAGSGQYEGTMYRSTDNGGTWVESANGLGPVSITSMVTTSQGYIVAASYGSSTTGYGIYISSDNGVNWNHTSITEGNFNVLFINSNGEIFAGGEKGKLLKSTDEGNTWSDISSGLPFDRILCLAQNPSGYLLAGTADNGIYITSEPTGVSFDNKVANFSLSQNYPNPFNPTTKINYEIPERCTVQLKIFNLLGQEIKSLVSEEQFAGKYEIEFDGGNLSSGVYFYKMSAGDFSETKKFIILR